MPPSAAVIAYLQLDPVFGDPARNRLQAEDLLKDAGPIDLLVLPELALTGYDFKDAAEVRLHAEPCGDGPSSDWLRALSRRTGGAVVMGYPELAAAGCHNSSMMALPDGSIANYRKIHLFNREKALFLPGDAPPRVHETPAGPVGMMICFDWFFPETARMLALAGALILAHPSNLVLDLCQRAMFARCVENRVFAVTANRTGLEDHAGRSLRFTGASQILGPGGETLARAPEEGASLGVARIDPSLAASKTVAGLNDLFADRRPELYGGLLAGMEGREATGAA